MKVKKNKSLQFLLTIILLLVVCTSYAIVAPSPPQPLAPNGPGPGLVPIDGGIAILLAAGVAYGIKKIKQKN